MAGERGGTTKLGRTEISLDYVLPGERLRVVVVSVASQCIDSSSCIRKHLSRSLSPTAHTPDPVLSCASQGPRASVDTAHLFAHVALPSVARGQFAAGQDPENTWQIVRRDKERMRAAKKGTPFTINTLHHYDRSHST